MNAPAIDDFFNEIDRNEDDARETLVRFLKSQLARLDNDTPDAIRAAYEIAGLIATDFARTLNASDPIDEILTIAGELEINPDNAAELREELIEKISRLQ